MLKKLENEALEIETAADPGKRRTLRIAVKTITQFLLMVAIIAGSVMGMNWLVETKPEKPRRPPFQSVYPVEAVTAKIANHSPTVLVYGQVASERSVDLRSFVSGEIVWVSEQLQAGSQVKAGDELVRINTFDYEGALTEASANLAQTDASIAEIKARLSAERDQLKAAREQLDLAKSDLQRAEQLKTTGSITTKQVEDRKLTVSVREQSVLQRESNIAIEEARLQQQEANRLRLQWKIKDAQKDLDDTIMKAPFSGVIRNSVAELGRTAGANDVLISMYSLDRLAARFTLTDAQFGRLVTDSDPLIGRNIEAYWSVGETEYKLTGNVSRIGADIDSARGGVEVFAALDPENLPSQIRPGAFLEIRLSDQTYSNTITVPEDSVYDTDRIYVISDGELKPRSVTALAYDNGNVIISGDIADGEQILSTRLSVASDGLKVRLSDSEIQGSGQDARSN